MDVVDEYTHHEYFRGLILVEDEDFEYYEDYETDDEYDYEQDYEFNADLAGNRKYENK